jgi:hypothetical protein
LGTKIEDLKRDKKAMCDTIREFIAEIRAREQAMLRNPTPEQAEYQRRERERLHELVEGVRYAVYWIDGEGVFDAETMGMLYKQAYGLHDIIDGDPIGTLEQRVDEHVREQTATMKRALSFDEL